MKKVQIIEMKEHEHGLIGMGDISYTYTVIDRKHELIIRLLLLDKELIYTGDEAKNIYHRVIGDSDTSTINLIKRLASESCGIPLCRIGEETRKVEPVFARSMVFWYVKTYMDFSYQKCGNLFGLNHATAINGIKLYKKEYKYLSVDQQAWKKKFDKKLIQYELK